jgi:hypothetical protein
VGGGGAADILEGLQKYWLMMGKTKFFFWFIISATTLKEHLVSNFCSVTYVTMKFYSIKIHIFQLVQEKKSNNIDKSKQTP